jgi:acyl-CoA oxidase
MGRITIITGSSRSSAICCQIALRYSCTRRQFGTGEVENPIIEYPLQQYRLIVPLAEATAHACAGKFVVKMWESSKDKLFEENNHDLAEVHALISAMKVITTESTAKSMHESRIACGGIGYSHYAGIGQRMNDHTVQETWEGDNNVLIQQTAKYILDLAKAKYKGMETHSKTCEDWLSIEPVFDARFTAEEYEDVFNPQELIKALQHRINALIQEVGLLLQEKIMANNMEPFAAWNSL